VHHYRKAGGLDAYDAANLHLINTRSDKAEPS
jgi:hypothetical protein